MSIARILAAALLALSVAAPVAVAGHPPPQPSEPPTDPCASYQTCWDEVDETEDWAWDTAGTTNNWTWHTVGAAEDCAWNLVRDEDCDL